MTTNNKSVSIVIPTLNAGRTLPACLESIKRQQYEGPVEIVVADGGSTDETLAVAGEYGCVIVDNPRRTGEAGKAVGVKTASGELVALVDSDNILTGADWLELMTAPFSDPGIAVELRHIDISPMVFLIILSKALDTLLLRNANLVNLSQDFDLRRIARSLSKPRESLNIMLRPLSSTPRAVFPTSPVYLPASDSSPTISVTALSCSGRPWTMTTSGL